MSKNFIINKKDLIFLPIGGCNEIGLNLNLYQYKGTWIMIDCGNGFAIPSKMPGVDIVIPDISFILRNNIKISAIILTHAHEDHIGGLPFLLGNFDCPIYTTKFTATFIKIKLKEFDFNDSNLKITEIIPGENDRFSVGPFDLQMMCLTHSTPEMYGVAIRTEEGNIFHTGDWKIENDPVIGKLSDFEGIKNFANEGILALICDSTNAMSKGHSGSEGELEDSIHEVVKSQKKLVVVTTFASNVARLQTIYNVATKNGRKVALSGLSMLRVVNAAKESGYLKDCDFVDLKDFASESKSKLLILCTGCQGEQNATIAKLVHGKHRLLKIDNGDTVIFSSKIIPGNEKTIGEHVNMLIDMGVNVITERHAKVHASGHPSQDELLNMYHSTNPQIIIPVHGESVHLDAHCKFALKHSNIKKAVKMKNGYVIKLNYDDKGVGCFTKLGEVFSDYIGVDGNKLRSETNVVISERKRLMVAGFMACNIVYTKEKKDDYRIISMKIITAGLMDDGFEAKEIEALEKDLLKRYKEFFDNDNLSKLEKKDKLAKNIKNYIVSKIIETFNKESLVKVYLNEV